MRQASLCGSILTVLAALTGCGSGEQAAGNAAAPTTARQDAPGAKWNAEDACSVLSRNDVEAVMGEKVTGTELGTVKRATADLAGFSTCHYLMPDVMRQVGFMARLSPEPDNTDYAIKQARDEVAEFMGPVSDEPGLGKSAFWVSKLQQMVVFFDENRYANITMPKGDEAAMRAKAKALLQKVR